MSGSGLGAIAAAVITVVLAFVTGIAALTGATPPSCAPAAAATTGGAGVVGGFDAEQITNAAAITGVATRLGLPRRAAVIAVATAITESSLRNVAHGDAAGPDSRGLFQQRAPWGPESVRMDPVGAAELFLTGGRGGQPGLVDIPDWETLPLAQAAQAVQRSAFPHRYAAHEATAQALVGVACVPDGDGLPEAGAVELPEGFTLPPGTSPQVVAAVTWALAQLGTWYSYGGDCTAARSGDPARRCDCSSLTMRAYSAAEIDLPRTTLGQVHAGRAVIDPSRLRAGDLVFIPGSQGTMASPRHLGLAIGDGLIVHAPGTGQQVRLARISDWSGQIAAIRRVVG